MTREEQIKQEIDNQLDDCSGEYADFYAQGFTDGARWADSHHDYDFDALDAKMLECEVSFMDEWLATHDNMPTFADALEWERETMIDKTCEWIESAFVEICDMSKIPYNVSIYTRYRRKIDLINDFKKAMEL